jgi:hypothetical protein
MIQTVRVGAWMAVTPSGRVPVHPGGTMPQAAATVPEVRQPGAANTSVHMSSIGRR